MKHVIAIVFTLLISTNLFAGTDKSAISINGNKVDKSVTEISYEDSVITLHWSDNTVMTNKLASTMAKLVSDYDIDKAYIASIGGIYGNSIIVGGTKSGSNINIYNVEGKKIQDMAANNDQTYIDISTLNTGIYLLQDNSTVIKFIKR
ncbi:MAG: T9SS type A sorting domain-containing protein [Prevotella sp.]